jgi:hypothetical protein
MKKYNLIYTSKENDHYLWNGKTFDKLESEGREVLFYSGKSIGHGEVQKALKKCRTAAKKLFPDDTNPEIKKVEIKVS